MRRWEDCKFADETLREGAARSFLPQDAEARIDLLNQIQRVTDIKNFCLGFAAQGGSDLELLRLVEQRTSNGELRRDLSYQLFSFYSTAGMLQSLYEASEISAQLVACQVVTASDDLLVASDGRFIESTLKLSTAASCDLLHERLCIALGGILEAHRRKGIKRTALLVQDAFRSDLERVYQYIDAAIAYDVQEVRLHDTVGIATPHSTETRIGQLVKRYPEVDFIAHMHNDFGLATANTCAAMLAGAAGADLSVTGIGSRAGNASMEQTLLALNRLFGMEMPNLMTEELTRLAISVESYSGIAQSPVAPITGPLVHFEEASPRSTWDRSALSPWNSYNSSDVGGTADIIFGDYTDKRQIEDFLKANAAELREFGADLNDNLVSSCLQWVHTQRRNRFDTYHGDAVIALRKYLEILKSQYVGSDELWNELARRQRRCRA